MREKSNRILRTTNILAMVLSLLVTAMLPVGYLISHYQDETAVLETKAGALARAVSDVISLNPDFWRYEKDRLELLLSQRFEYDNHEEVNRIVDLDNKIIASNSATLAPPWIMRSQDLYDSGEVVARVEVFQSIRHLFKNSFIVLLIGLIFGSVVFAALKLFPLRALEQTLSLFYESEEKFRAITVTAIDGIIVMDEHGCITYWNPAAEKIFGYSPQEVIGRDLHALLAPPEYYELYKTGFEHFNNTGEGYIIGQTLETEAIRKDGTIFPIELSTSISKIQGKAYAVGLIHDISARKTAQKEIFNSQQMLRLVLDNIPQRVFWKSKDCLYLGCNKPFAIDAGFPDPKDIIGKSDFELSWQENAKTYQDVDRSVMETKMERVNYEDTRKRQNGSMRWLNKNKIPLLDKMGNVFGVLGTYEDITKRKESEQKLAHLYGRVKNEAEISRSLFNLVETMNTSLDEKELISKVLHIAPKYLQFDRMVIFLLNEERNIFAFSGGYGLSSEEEDMLYIKPFRAGDFRGIEKKINGEAIIIDKAGEKGLLSTEVVERFNISSAVLSPISFRGKINGIIFGDYTTRKTIEQRDVALLKGLANGLGIALQNSKLYKESNERLSDLTHKIETINAMAQLDREILSTIDRSSILRTATALTSRLIPCDRVAILLKDGSNYRAITEWGLGKFADKTYSIKRSHFGIIQMRQGSLLIPDLSTDSIDCVYHKDQGELGIKSSLIIPLINKGEVLGLLDIGSLYYERLNTDHISTAEKIASQITVALENAKLYEDLGKLLINTITSLISVIDAKSPWTKGHSERVTQYAVEIAKEMGLQDKDVDHLKLCGILHDIGKIGTYDSLLEKTDKLTDEEYALIKKHPEKGAEILKPIKQLNDVIPGILHHHERYDGKGYPDGLKGKDIPLCASILSVADSFDSMVADRPYRRSTGKEYAIAELKRCAGSQFDPMIVEAFLRVIERLDGDIG